MLFGAVKTIGLVDQPHCFNDLVCSLLLYLPKTVMLSCLRLYWCLRVFLFPILIPCLVHHPHPSWLFSLGISVLSTASLIAFSPQVASPRSSTDSRRVFHPDIRLPALPARFLPPAALLQLIPPFRKSLSDIAATAR